MLTLLFCIDLIYFTYLFNFYEKKAIKGASFAAGTFQEWIEQRPRLQRPYLKIISILVRTLLQNRSIRAMAKHTH